MTPDEIVTQWTPMVERLMTEKPELRIVLTVSPYRYAKYGFHGSQLSKAALLLAADELCRRFAGACHYFPAYEIVTDELRDYRFTKPTCFILRRRLSITYGNVFPIGLSAEKPVKL